MKILQKICFVLLLTTFSSVYGESRWYCDGDVAYCRVKAEQGDAKGQFSLGLMYYSGSEGVIQDYKEGVKWYRKAAEQGHTLAQIILGHLYFQGNGVGKDYIMAHMYWNIAAVSGDKEALVKRGSVAREMTDSQIEEAQRMAREWMRTHQ